MLSVIKIADAEYPLGQVALGIEEYYLGVGEAPGVWAGRWSGQLGLEGVVEAGQLRALVNGVDPRDGTWWLEGRPARKVNAFDATFSAPKSASVLWAFASAEVTSIVSRAHVQAVGEALAFLEDKAAVSRQQTDGVRTRVGTQGWAVATFVHRTSRAGDPQLHTHCIVPNVVERADGSFASVDGAVLYTWAKAAGSVYQEQLRRILTDRLGVAWGPDRNGTREMVGFSAAQLRAFSKRTAQIDAYLEQVGGVYRTAVERMRASHVASLATRPAKDRTLTPERLRDRWADEATAAGLAVPLEVEHAVLGRGGVSRPVTFDDVAAALVHPETGLCANDSRFGEAHVVEKVAAVGAGRLTVAEIRAFTAAFLDSEHVVRLGVDPADAVRTPPTWTTTAHLALEQRVLERLDRLINRDLRSLEGGVVERAIAGEGRLGADQAEAVRVLCGPGPAVRSLIAPAGFGKTSSVHAAAVAASGSGLSVLGVAATNRAVAELRDVGIPAVTIARLAIDLADRPLHPGTVVILDEASLTATADAEIVLAAVLEAHVAQLWCLGDVRQAQAVRAGGLAAELDRLGRHGRIPAATLGENRRQHHPAERAALAAYRAGDLEASQTIRTAAGLEHELATPLDTREAMASAVAGALIDHGVDSVIALAVSHADCEDIADRIRARRAMIGALNGPTLEGPGWGSDPRSYQAGDRVLLHARVGKGPGRLHNGTTVFVTAVTPAGLAVVTDHGARHVLPADFVTGRRRDGRPNVSHAWCRTVDGAQGGTWDHAHLLGSSALDNFTGYVGQSRARVETHTWNVRHLPAGDWGGRLADDRTGAQQVLDAERRAPLKTFAAHNDPNTLDRQLTAEIAEHRAVLAQTPPDVAARITKVRDEIARAEQAACDAGIRIAYATERAAAVGPIAALRRAGRDERASWQAAAERSRRELEAARANVAELGHQGEQLAQADTARTAWLEREGWRSGRLAQARIELDRHWATTVATAVAQGDPLAFGIDRLRAARTAFAAEIGRLDAGLPPDRSGALATAQQALANAEALHRQATTNRDRAAQHLEDASRRRFGRRDKTTLEHAGQRFRSAEEAVVRAGDVAERARDKVGVEQAAVTLRATAEAAAADQRRTLVHNLAAVRDAVDTTRPERVLAAAAGHPSAAAMRELLGDPPPPGRGRDTWLRIAEDFETALDHPDQTGDYLEHRARAALSGNRDAAQEVRAFVNGAVEAADRPRTTPNRDPALGFGSYPHAVHDFNRRPPDRGIDLGR